MKSYTSPEPVQFWRWINPSTIALVTPTSAYHWSMDGDSAPQKVCDRHANLAESQIINYHATDDLKWILIVGISKSPTGAIAGNMQLYSLEKRVSQPLNGHAGFFARVAVGGNTESSNVLCFAEKKEGTPSRVCLFLSIYPLMYFPYKKRRK